MMRTGNILVADDDRAIRTVLSQALGRQGHTVQTTGTASTLWQPWGYHDRSPIFVVGMPRSGSTLIEQLLASHTRAAVGFVRVPVWCPGWGWRCAALGLL